jgi:predicted enzyme related to lactoylglutathione lyase
MISSRIIWAGLYVNNLAEQVAFYRDTIGLPLKRQGRESAIFDAGGNALFELQANGVASASPKATGQQSLVIGFQVEKLEVVVAELKEKGVTFIEDIGSYKNQRWAIFTDPEGNKLELKEILPVEK